MTVIKLKITQAGFDEHISIDEWFNFNTLTNKELYEMMLNFAVTEDGAPLTVDEARKAFRTIKKSEWSEYVTEFYKAVTDAFVSPTSGGS